MRKIFSLLLVAAGMFCTIQSAQALDANVKAYAHIETGSGTDLVDLNAYLFNDLSAKLYLPDQNATVDLRNDITADIYANVGSNLKHRHYTYNTGITIPTCESLPQYDPTWTDAQKEQFCNTYYTSQQYQDALAKVLVKFNDLSVEAGMGSLANFYSFTKAKAKVTVMVDGGIDNDGEEKDFWYVLTGADEDPYRVISADVIEAELRDAINLAKTQCTTIAPSTGLCIKSGSYILYGEERMDFNEDMVISKTNLSMERILEALSDATTIRPSGNTGTEASVAVIRLLAGSYVPSSSKNAVLNQDVTITIDASKINTSADIMPNLLSTLKGYAEAKNRTAFFKSIVRWLNCMAAKIEGAGYGIDDHIDILVDFDYIPWNVVRGANNSPIKVVKENDQDLTEGQVGTFCCPWEIAQTRGGVVYEIEMKDNADNALVREVTLKEADYPLEAGRPYVFRIGKGATKLEALFGSASPVYGSTQTASFNGLIGCQAQTGNRWTVVTAENYEENRYCVLYQNKLRHAAIGSQVKDGMAYFDLSDISLTGSNAPARRLKIGGSKVTTETELVAEDVKATKTLRNGHLVIIRSGIHYNAQGQIVK